MRYKCPSCGNEFEGKPTHCPSCGTKFKYKEEAEVIEEKVQPKQIVKVKRYEESSGSYIAGALLGLFYGFLGLLIGFAVDKKNTVNGAIAGFVTRVVLRGVLFILWAGFVVLMMMGALGGMAFNFSYIQNFFANLFN